MFLHTGIAASRSSMTTRIPAPIWQDTEKVRQRRSRVAQRLTVRQRVRFASLLAAALLDRLFEHPVLVPEPGHDVPQLHMRILSK